MRAGAGGGRASTNEREALALPAGMRGEQERRRAGEKESRREGEQERRKAGGHGVTMVHGRMSMHASGGNACMDA